MKKVLITGSSGFVGKKLTAALQDWGVDVVGFDLTDGKDINDDHAFNGVDAVDIVVHLAAKVFVPDAFKNAAEIYKANINGTINALEYCREHAVKRFVYTSSYVYGNPEYLPIDENHPTKISNPYGRSKLIGEIICMGYCQDYGIVPVILRPFNIYGPGQSRKFLIPMLVEKIVNDDCIAVNDLNPKRDFIYVDDVIDIYLRLLKNYPFLEPGIFNIGSGKSHSVKEIVDMLQDIAGTHKPTIETGMARKNEIPDCVADTTRIEQLLDFKPNIDIWEGLKKMVAMEMGR